MILEKNEIKININVTELNKYIKYRLAKMQINCIHIFLFFKINYNCITII